MQGKIKFYNEEKGFGKILSDQDIEYFFHISKVSNSPEKISKNDNVTFDGFETNKGLNATNILFQPKIICPVCSWNNIDDTSSCKNCSFSLKFVRGYSVENISDIELQEYKTKLQKAKVNYQQTKQEKSRNLSVKKLTSKMLKKDKFETTEEYEERIKNLGNVEIGTVKLIDYDADTKILDCQLVIPSISVYVYSTESKIDFQIQIKALEARKIYSKKKIPLEAKIEIQENIIKILDCKFDKYNIFDKIEEKQNRNLLLQEYIDELGDLNSYKYIDNRFTIIEKVLLIYSSKSYDCLANKDFNNANFYYERMNKINANHRLTHRCKGAIYFAKGNIEQALKSFALQDKKFYGYAELCQEYRRAGNTIEAIKYCEKVVKIDPKSVFSEILKDLKTI